MSGRVTEAVAVEAPPRLEPLDRLVQFFDAGSFEQVRAQVQSRKMSTAPPGDAVVAGLGRINGAPVFAYAQDQTFLGGSLGVAHAATITRVLDSAERFGHPVVAFIASAGARLQEGTDALSAYGGIFRRQVALSGRVLQVAVVSGAAAGGASYSPALMDLVVMTPSARMFLTGPSIVRAAVGEELDAESLGGPAVHERNGVAHFTADSDTNAAEYVREAIDMIAGPPVEPAIDVSASQPELGLIVPADQRKVYDVRDVARRLLDDDTWLEAQPRWARNIVTGFGRLGGQAVGVIANQPRWIGGVLDSDAASKGARFVQTCNCFGLPLVVLVDTPGFLPGSQQEHNGVIRHGAKLLHAFAKARVPKVTVVLRKAYGGALIAMNSKELGADLVLAWPGAELGVMSAVSAVQLVNRRELAAAGAGAGELLGELAGQYRQDHLLAARAAEHGHIDEVVEPRRTRARLAHAISAMQTSQELTHASNIPL